MTTSKCFLNKCCGWCLSQTQTYHPKILDSLLVVFLLQWSGIWQENTQAEELDLIIHTHASAHMQVSTQMHTHTSLLSLHTLISYNNQTVQAFPSWSFLDHKLALTILKVNNNNNNIVDGGMPLSYLRLGLIFRTV